MTTHQLHLAEPGSDCRWAGITYDQDRCNALADWVLTPPGGRYTRKVCAAHAVSTHGAAASIVLDVPTDPTSRQRYLRRASEALARLADAHAHAG